MDKQWLGRNHNNSLTDEQRFWEKVNIGDPDECWEWLAGKCKGYGMFWVENRSSHIRANRMAWELIHGSIPDGMQILHTCDNPGCVNPKHLWLGTHQDNMIDMFKKGRGNRHLAFNVEQVKEIRNLYSSGNYSYREIGKIFGVGHSEIGQIIRREIWKASF